MDSYTTLQGDTFDKIAKQLYGNERRMDILVAANMQHAATAVFGANLRLSVPPLPEALLLAETDAAGLPPWRKAP